MTAYFYTTNYNSNSILYFYLIGYFFLLLAAVAFFLSSGNPSSINKGEFSNFSFGFNAKARLTTLAVVFCSMAGIPPFYFFLCKLAALSIILNFYGYSLLFVASILLLVGWYTYQTAISRTLTASSTQTVQLKPARTPLKLDFYLVTIVALVIMLSLWADDIVLVALWLAS